MFKVNAKYVHYVFTGGAMDEYKEPYLLLFNRITDALAELEKQNYGTARELLRQAQIDAEELYISEA